MCIRDSRQGAQSPPDGGRGRHEPGDGGHQRRLFCPHRQPALHPGYELCKVRGEGRARTAQTKEDTAQAILNVLAESKLGSMPSTQLRAEVMKEMGCSEKTYNRAYSELAKSGEIKKQQFNQKNGTRGWFTFLGYCSKTNDQVTI